MRGELSSFAFVKVYDEQLQADKLQIKVEFKRAGGETVATIDVESAHTEVASTYQGFAIVMTDLHRGNRGNMTNEVKRTGRVWSFVIDGTWGAFLFLLGTGLSVAVYYWFVP